MKTERFSAMAALNFEGDPDKQKYATYYGETLDEAVQKAEKYSLTGEAYSGCLERFQYGEWQIVEMLDIH